MNTLSNYIRWAELRAISDKRKTLEQFAAELAAKMDGQLAGGSLLEAVVKGPLAEGSRLGEARTVTLLGPGSGRAWRSMCRQTINLTPSYAQLVYNDARAGLRNQLVAANNGTEEPGLGADGNHWIYCWNPGTRENCWYCFETDMSCPQITARSARSQ
jgi:hypothetical protein